jgi:glycosidase
MNRPNWYYSPRSIAGLVGLTLIGQSAQSCSGESWQDQSIYQIITDRFFDGDQSNNNADGNYNPRSARGSAVHGGDFKGIEQKLDYIKALGATAIWISPVVLNANGEFHGYAARDFLKVDPHWGSLADLQHLVQAAHAKALLVIDDVVANHGGDLIDSSDAGYPAFRSGGYNLRYRSSKQFAAPFNTNAINPWLTNLFHNHGRIQDYRISLQAELGELSGLDDFRTESAYVRSNMVEVYKYWIREAGFDGFRVDTAKHVEMGFWQEWCPALHAFAAANGKPNFFMFGEVLDRSDAKCGFYTGTRAGGAFAFDSVLDYPLYFKLNTVFATATGKANLIEERYDALAGNYDALAQTRLVTFLDNHDQARFLSQKLANNETNRLLLALTFLFTSRGIPCLYYGTEQAFNGATDPNDREDMFDGEFEQGPSLGDNFNLTHPVFKWVAKLNNFRRLYPALRTGTHGNRWADTNGPGLLAYARCLGKQEVFVVLNTAASNQILPNRSTTFAPGTIIVNAFDTNETLTVSGTAEIPSISIPPVTAKLFVAQTDWRPLDPVVVSNAPAHDASNVPIDDPIVLQFSEAMDTNSVESAFAIAPPVTGLFSWSSSHDTLTFTPGRAGLLPSATIKVQLTNSGVRTRSATAMFGGYELKFKTAPATSATNSRRAGQ